MEKEFIPFYLAVKLKELGFNSKCFAYYSIGEIENRPIPMGTVCGWEYGDVHFGVFNPEYQYKANNKLVAAPLWQQVFDWFDEEFNLASCIDIVSKGNYQYKIVNYSDYVGDDTTLCLNGFSSKLLAQQTCLQRLIAFLQ